MIGELNKTLKVNNEAVSETPDYLTYSVTYADGMEILENHKIEAGETETYKVRLEFKTDIEELPEATTITTSLEPQYLQADSSSVVRPNVFLYGTWDQIVDAYNSSNITHLQEAMEAGTTREVGLDMDYDGTYETTAHVRIANLSKPDECSTSGFSQTACGFVIEFADVISVHRMNPYTEGLTNGDGNKGGWEYSDMKAYLNSKKYLEGETAEIDYTLSGIFNALSSDLKNIIINTKVISGYFSRDSVNYVTTDKLYLLDSKEIYGSSFAETQNRAKDQERQLDFYLSKNVTTSSYSEAIKKDLGGLASYWWLRSARSHVFGCFFTVVIFGGSDFNSSSYNYGVFPAFRIAE